MNSICKINAKIEVGGENLKLRYLYGAEANNDTYSFIKAVNEKDTLIKDKICKIIFNG